MVPVIKGATIDECAAYLPPNSYIHVENFTSPAALVKWLKYLDSNPDAYG